MDLQDIVTRWRCTANEGDLVRWLVVIVGQNQRTEVYVVRKTGRPVDMNRADNSITILD